MKEVNLDVLIKKLSVLSTQKELDILAVDLHDIYESSNNFEKLYDDLINNSYQEKEQFIAKFIEIEIELDHINWHSKSLKKELKKLIGADLEIESNQTFGGTS